MKKRPKAPGPFDDPPKKSKKETFDRPLLVLLKSPDNPTGLLKGDVVPSINKAISLNPGLHTPRRDDTHPSPHTACSIAHCHDRSLARPPWQRLTS